MTGGLSTLRPGDKSNVRAYMDRTNMGEEHGMKLLINYLDTRKSSAL